VTALPYFDIAASGFFIRAVNAGDAKACRMLLSTTSVDASQFVAIDRLHGLVIGAAAVTSACRPWPIPGPGAMIHVIPPCRQCGVGSALCSALIAVAREHGMGAIYAARKSPAEGEETLGWRRLGFTPCETIEEHQLPLDQFVPRLEPLVARFRRLGRIPTEARIVPLYEADREQVLRLHLDHLGGDRESLDQKLSGRGRGAFHLRYSRVLLVGDQVVGCILTHLQPPRVAVVDANIVTPEFRGGWANLWLKLEATQGALALGITHFHFTTFDHYADTRSFTAKLGGVLTRRLVLMHRRLD
jgi:N-acetylglutamate synthase-like GNAT family acetyltransferase